MVKKVHTYFSRLGRDAMGILVTRKQTAVAMEICKKWYPDEDHVFIFDNAKTHTKRADDAQSALHMPKGPSQVFGVEVNDLASDGSLQYETNGKIKKRKYKWGMAPFKMAMSSSFTIPTMLLSMPDG